MVSEACNQVNVRGYVQCDKLMYVIKYMTVMSQQDNWENAENLSANADESPIEVVIERLAQGEKRSNWMILVGAPDWVRGVIQRLHLAQIVEVGSWSKLLPTRNPDEVISVLQRRRNIEVGDRG